MATPDAAHALKLVDDAWTGLVRRGDVEASTLTRDAETQGVMLQASGKKALDREGQEAASPMDAIKLTQAFI